MDCRVESLNRIISREAIKVITTGEVTNIRRYYEGGIHRGCESRM